jgi:hypothetical protein
VKLKRRGFPQQGPSQVHCLESTKDSDAHILFTMLHSLYGGSETLRLKRVSSNTDPQGQDDTIGPSVVRTTRPPHFGGCRSACGPQLHRHEARMLRQANDQRSNPDKPILIHTQGSDEVCRYITGQEIGGQGLRTIEILPSYGARSLAIVDL